MLGAVAGDAEDALEGVTRKTAVGGTVVGELRQQGGTWNVLLVVALDTLEVLGAVKQAAEHRLVGYEGDAVDHHLAGRQCVGLSVGLAVQGAVVAVAHQFCAEAQAEAPDAVEVDVLVVEQVLDDFRFSMTSSSRPRSIIVCCWMCSASSLV